MSQALRKSDESRPIGPAPADSQLRLAPGAKWTNHATDHCAAASVMVSTVDRYQGDENDIVILSLVRTRPGNRFVALRNRFIVAASRARLAFYMIGSVSAVSGVDKQPGPPHWRRLLECLSTPPGRPPQEPVAQGSAGPEELEAKVADKGQEQRDVPSDVADPDCRSLPPPPPHTSDESSQYLDNFSGPRIGSELPICCPHHPFVQALVSKADGFP
eukprot:scaffold634071_cov56-Prasinocladus_malaysianus.AAC.1